MIQFFPLSSEPIIINGWGLFRNADIYLLPLMRTQCNSAFSLPKCKMIWTSGLSVYTVELFHVIIGWNTFLHVCSTAVM